MHKKKYKLTVCSKCGALKREPITIKQSVPMIGRYINTPHSIDLCINSVTRSCCIRCIFRFLDEHIGEITVQNIEE